MARLLTRALLLLGIACFIGGLVFSGSLLQWMLEFSSRSSEFAEHHVLLFAVVFSLSFILMMTLGLPGGALFSILSGYFYGYAGGFALALLSATASALCVWALVRSSAIDFFPHVLSKQRMAAKRFVHSEAFWVPLLIRLVPIFPFYLVNILLSKVDTSVKSYFITAAIGLTPSILAFVSMGKALRNSLIIEQGSLSMLLTNPYFCMPVIVLLVLSGASFVIRYRISPVKRNKV